MISFMSKSLHGYIVVNGFELDLVVGITFVDIHAKFKIKYPHRVFEMYRNDNVMPWNAMVIACVTNHAHGKDSIMKRLLSRRENRVFFSLVLNMDRAQIVFNNENDTPLAVLTQDNLHTVIKIFPFLLVSRFLWEI